eukprot:3902916-Prymnesium_polylepis.2
MRTAARACAPISWAQWAWGERRAAHHVYVDELWTKACELRILWGLDACLLRFACCRIEPA